MLVDKLTTLNLNNTYVDPYSIFHLMNSIENQPGDQIQLCKL